jgi:hypothetical protein
VPGIITQKKLNYGQKRSKKIFSVAKKSTVYHNIVKEQHYSLQAENSLLLQQQQKYANGLYIFDKN